jgi:NAD(P)-dependent dehydrogenase (short-subunit alcohol dehydrogenase family)
MARICLVTGANRGIGLEFARQLLARGDRVVATCRQPGKATALNTLAGEYPGRLHVLPLDVADARSRAELVRELPLALGDDAPRLDLLVNNAGVLHSGERFGQVDAAVLEDSLRINAVGPFLLAQALVPLMRETVAGHGGEGGAVKSLPDTRLVDRTPGTPVTTKAPHGPYPVIANLSSVMGSIACRREFRSPGYCASKAAQNMLTVQLAHALAERGIVVLALHPGWVQTDWLRRLLRLARRAAAVVSSACSGTRT